MELPAWEEEVARTLLRRKRGPAVVIEVFPKHVAIGPGDFGDAIRGSPEIHCGANRLFCFYGADYTMEAQIEYLKGPSPKTTCGGSSRARSCRISTSCHVPQEASQLPGERKVAGLHSGSWITSEKSVHRS